MIQFKELLNEDGKELASSGGTALYLTDGSPVTLGVNRVYEKLTEIEEREVIGRHMHDLETNKFSADQDPFPCLFSKTKRP